MANVPMGKEMLAVCALSVSVATSTRLSTLRLIEDTIVAIFSSKVALSS